jgi:hypothetical protein
MQQCIKNENKGMKKIYLKHKKTNSIFTFSPMRFVSGCANFAIEKKRWQWLESVSEA